MDEEYAEKIEAICLGAGLIVGAGLSLTTIVNLFVGSNMNKLLGSVKNLQIIVHMTLMSVVMPANAQVLMSVIFEWITFDLYDTSSLTSSYYSPVETDVDDRLVQLGYGSAYALINLGSCIYFIFGQIICFLFELLFLACFRL